MDILVQSVNPANSYLQERKVNELFQSITVGLVHHRPENPNLFILDCLQHASDIGWQNVSWDTFLPRGRRRLEVVDKEREDRSKEKGETQAKQTGATEAKNRQPDCQDDSCSGGLATDNSDQPKKNDITGIQDDEDDEDDDESGKGSVDSTMRRILQGSVEDLPLMPSNTVRIFLSSTFSDYKAERNILPRRAYPELSAFCRERGLDFQVVDMRWGVTDDVVNDHQVSELCLKEIALCQQVSCGPNFVTLLGNRYGYRPFPVRIKDTEFEQMASIAARDMGANAQQLLAGWFWKDDNAVPADYILQPIPTKLKHYNDFSAENAEKRQEARQKWDGIFQELRMILGQCSLKAVEDRIMDGKDAEKYHISVTENEVHYGLLQPENVSCKALCYIRRLAGIDETPASGNKKQTTSKFVDCKADGLPDEGAVRLAMSLQEEKIPSKLQGQHLRKYQLEWKGVPLEESGEGEHLAYLEKFCDDFVTDMEELISRNLRSDKSKTQEARLMYHEVLHHAKFAQNKCEIFCGRTRALEQVRGYLTSTGEDRSPMIICGQSGFGKTSLMSYIAKSMSEWVSGPVCVVLRLLGTTPNSSNILATLKSVIHQICLVHDLPLPVESAMVRMTDVRLQLWSVLDTIGKDHPDKKLVVLLDSVDQLLETYGGHGMVWLPRRLPQNVSLIVSMLSDRYTCLANTRLRIPEEENYCELEPLSATTGEHIISAYMQLHHRCLTDEQGGMVTQAFSGCRQPLFLKLVLDSARTWNSYTPVESISIATGVHEAITHLFESLEATYGKTFVEKSLGYLTSGHGGLTSLELEDVLSCDDEVLVGVYQYHDPPLEGTVRIPSLLWSRVEHFLREYLVERQVHGKTVLTWYHRQFWETAEERYQCPENTKLALHSTMADLFDQEAGIQRTITLTLRRGKVVEDADRRVTPQPLTVNNLRKLQCLPFHLLHAGRTQDLKSKCLINFQWTLTKLKAVGARELLQEYNEAVADPRLRGCKAIEMVRNLLELCYDALHCDPELLPYHVWDRMTGLELDPLLEAFVEDAQKWMQECQTPLLLPAHPMNFHGLESSLMFSIVVGYDGVMSSDEKLMVCNVTRGNSSQNKLQALVLDTKDIVSSVTVSKKTLVTIDKTNRFFLYFDMQRLKMCEIESGELVKEVMYGTTECESDVPRFIEMSRNGKYLALGVRYGKPRNVKGKAAWKAECLLSLVDMDSFESSIVNVPFKGSKQVNSAVFVEGDTQLVCLSRDDIIVYDVPSLDIVHQLGDVQGIYGRTYQHLPGWKSVVAGVKDIDGAEVLIYSYMDNTFQLSKALQVDEATSGEVVEPFAVQANDGDSCLVVMGVNTMELAGHACLWIWDCQAGDQDRGVEYTQIPIGVGVAKLPTTMKVTPDWAYALVGWDNGDLSMVSLEKHREVLTLSAHGHALHFTGLIDSGRRMITMSSDHSLKMWDLTSLRQEATCNLDKGQEHTAKQHDDILDDQEPCLDLACLEDCILTVNHLGYLRFWDLESGKLLHDCTSKHQMVHRNSLDARGYQNDPGVGRQSASVDVYADTVLFARKVGHDMSLRVVKDIRNPAILAHQHIREAFFCLPPNARYPIPSISGKEELILVRDGSLELRELTSLKVTRKITIPEIARDVGNISSHGGKRKLMHMKTAMTFDGKYFILMNPSPPKQKNKYFHLVDLLKGEYEQEVDMEAIRFMPWKILGFYSFYFMVWKKGQLPEICGPSKMPEDDLLDYKCLLYSDKSFLSENISLGFEFTQDYSIYLWQVAPLIKLHTLKGHTTEVTSGCISKDNLHFVSGSYDNTVRLWSVPSGQQLCMFHTYGAVDKVFISPSGDAILVHCFATPERKRAVILAINNVRKKDTKKLRI